MSSKTSLTSLPHTELSEKIVFPISQARNLPADRLEALRIFESKLIQSYNEAVQVENRHIAIFIGVTTIVVVSGLICLCFVTSKLGIHSDFINEFLDWCAAITRCIHFVGPALTSFVILIISIASDSSSLFSLSLIVFIVFGLTLARFWMNPKCHSALFESRAFENRTNRSLQHFKLHFDASAPSLMLIGAKIEPLLKSSNRSNRKEDVSAPVSDMRWDGSDC